MRQVRVYSPKLEKYFTVNFEGDADPTPDEIDVAADAYEQQELNRPTDQGRASTIASGVARGATTMFPMALQGAGELLGSPSMIEAGQAGVEALEETLPVNPAFRDEFWTGKAPQAVGQGIGMLATGGAIGLGARATAAASGLNAMRAASLAGRAASGSMLTLGGAMGAAEGAQEADQMGLTGARRYASLVSGAFWEVASEKLPFGMLAETSALKRMLGDTLTSKPITTTGIFATNAAEEMITAAGTGVTGNVLASIEGVEGKSTAEILANIGEAGLLGAVGALPFAGMNLVAPRQQKTLFGGSMTLNEGDTEVQLDGVTWAAIPAGSNLTPEQVNNMTDEELDSLIDSGGLKIKRTEAAVQDELAARQAATTTTTVAKQAAPDAQTAAVIDTVQQGLAQKQAAQQVAATPTPPTVEASPVSPTPATPTPTPAVTPPAQQDMDTLSVEEANALDAEIGLNQPPQTDEQDQMPTVQQEQSSVEAVQESRQLPVLPAEPTAQAPQAVVTPPDLESGLSETPQPAMAADIVSGLPQQPQTPPQANADEQALREAEGQGQENVQVQEADAQQAALQEEVAPAVPASTQEVQQTPVPPAVDLGAVQRDATKPEQMTPEELFNFEKAKAISLAEENLRKAKSGEESPNTFTNGFKSKAALVKARQAELKTAQEFAQKPDIWNTVIDAKNNQSPVAVALVEGLSDNPRDGNGIDSPRKQLVDNLLGNGYVKQGDLYVYQPAAETTTETTPAEAQPTFQSPLTQGFADQNQAELPATALAKYTPEVMQQVDTYMQTGDRAALDGLTKIQQQRAIRYRVDNDTAARAEQQRRDAETERRNKQMAREDAKFARETTDVEALRQRERGIFAEDKTEEAELAELKADPVLGNEVQLEAIEENEAAAVAESEVVEPVAPVTIQKEVVTERAQTDQLLDSASLDEVQAAAPISVANATAAAATAESKAKWLAWLKENISHLTRFAEKIWKQATASVAAIAAILSPSASVNKTQTMGITPADYVVAEFVAKPNTFGKVAPWIESQKPPVKMENNPLQSYPEMALPELSRIGGEVVLNLTVGNQISPEFKKTPMDQARQAAKRIKEGVTMAVLPKRAARYFLSKGSSAHVDAMADMLFENESDSPKIAAMLRGMGVTESPDTFPWCATSVSYALTRGGVKASNTSSRSFLGFGQNTVSPAYGDIVVMWNDNPATGGKNGWGGHVGFYLGEVGDTIAVLSGNANDEVNVSLYSKDRVLAYRAPRSPIGARQSRRRSTPTNDSPVDRQRKSRGKKPRMAIALMEQDGRALAQGVTVADIKLAVNQIKRQLPEASNMWYGTVQDFINEFKDNPDVADMVNALQSGAMSEGFFSPQLGRGFLFTDVAVTYEGDAARAKRNETSPAVEVVKRLLRHEVGGHGGWSTLTEAQRERFLRIATEVIPESDIQSMIDDGYPFENWRTDSTIFEMAAEEWFSQQLGRLDALPETGPMARFVEWIKDVWRWLTGNSKDIDPTIEAVKDLWKQIRTNNAERRMGRGWFGVRESRVSETNQRDAEYLAAIEAGDLETAQRMVDEAARKAGLSVVFRGHKPGFPIGTKTPGVTAYVSTNKAYAEAYSDETEKVAASGSVVAKTLYDPGEYKGNVVSRFFANQGKQLNLSKWRAEDQKTIDEWKAVLSRKGIDVSSVAAFNELAELEKKQLPKVVETIVVAGVGWDGKGFEVTAKLDDGTEVKVTGPNGTKLPVADSAYALNFAQQEIDRKNQQSAVVVPKKYKLYELYDPLANSDVSGRNLMEVIRGAGYDSVLLPREGGESGGKSANAIAILTDKIQSADPVTRDYAGNVIPLSQRFQSTSNDIRYSRVRSNADIANAVKVIAGRPITPYVASENRVISAELATRLGPGFEDLRTAEPHMVSSNPETLARVEAMLDIILEPSRDPSQMAEMTPQEAQQGQDPTVAEASHREAIQNAIALDKPVSASAVAQYGISLPDSYQQFGELWARSYPQFQRAVELTRDPEWSRDAGMPQGSQEAMGLATLLEARLAAAIVRSTSEREQAALGNLLRASKKNENQQGSEWGRAGQFLGWMKRKLAITDGGGLALLNGIVDEQNKRIDNLIPVFEMTEHLEQQNPAIEQTAKDVTTDTVENEILMLWERMMDEGDSDIGLQIASLLRSLMPQQRVNLRDRINGMFTEAGFREKMNARGGELARQFFNILLPGEAQERGALADFDQAIQKALADRLRQIMIDLGMVQENQTTNDRSLEQLVMTLSDDPLRAEKIQRAIAAFEARLGQETDPEMQAALRDAWETVTAQLTTSIASPAVIRRVIRNQMETLGIKHKDILKRFRDKFDPANNVNHNDAVADIRNEVLDGVMLSIKDMVETSNERNQLEGAPSQTVQDNVAQAMQEVADEFDRIIGMKFAGWARSQAAVAQKARATMEAALNNTPGDPTNRITNSLRMLIQSEQKKPMDDFVNRARTQGLSQTDAVALQKAIERFRIGRILQKPDTLLKAMVNKLKNKMFLGATWRDIIVADATDGKERVREIYKRIRLNEQLRGLTQEEAIQLAQALNRQFLNEKAKAIQNELKRFGAGETVIDSRIQALIDKSKSTAGITAQEIEVKLMDIAQRSKHKKLQKEMGQIITRIANGQMTAEQLQEIVGAPRRVGDDQLQRIIDSVPKLVQAMNLGAFNDAAFREAVADKFKMRTITQAEAREAQRLAGEIEKAPKGIPRVQAQNKLLEFLQDKTGLTTVELTLSYWVSSILSGGRTLFDMAFNILNSFRRIAQMAGFLSMSSVGTSQGTAALRRQAAKQSMMRFFQVLPEVAADAWTHIKTGERAILLSEARETDKALREGGLSSAMDTQRLEFQRQRGGLPGGVATFIVMMRRIMGAMDYMSAAANLEAMVPVAIAMNPNLSTSGKLPTKQDYEIWTQRAQDIITGGRKPTNQREAALVRAQARELMLDETMTQSLRDETTLRANESSYQNDPSGLGGIFYRGVLAAHSAIVSKAQGLVDAGEANAANIDSRALRMADMAWRRLVYYAAVSSRAALGFQFARFAGNKTNELISMTPAIGLLRLSESDKSSTKRAQILMDQMLGVMLTAAGLIYYFLEMGDGDEEEEGKRIEGSWANLTVEQTRQLRAAGKEPYTISFFNAEKGTWDNYKYSQWATSGAMAFLGNMSDRRKYTPDLWTTDGMVGMLLAAATSQWQVAMDQSALSQLNEVMGRNGAWSQRDPAAGVTKQMNKIVADLAGGFVPRALKDLDYMLDPAHRKAETGFELWTQHVPFYRRTIGKEYLDSLGNQVELRRSPWSRAYFESGGSPAHNSLAKLINAGVFVSSLNLDNRKVGTGDKVRNLTDTEKKAFETRYFPALQRYLVTTTPELLRLPREEAQKKIRDDIYKLKNQVEDSLFR